MVMSTLSAVALMVLATRIYFSRSLLLATMAVWAVGVVAHRVVRRRRPWIEPMVVFSSDQEMVRELQLAPHADVRAVIDPSSHPDHRPLDPEITLVVDMAAALSPEVARLVVRARSGWSRCETAGFRLRGAHRAGSPAAIGGGLADDHHPAPGGQLVVGESDCSIWRR